MNKVTKRILLEKIKADRKLSGEFGEAIGKAWLKGDGWEFFDLNEKGLIPNTHEIYKKGAKKADQIGAHDEHKNTFVIWDQKFHRLYDDKYFKLRKDELAKYQAFIQHTKELIDDDDDIIFLFMYLPKIHDGEKICLVDINQFRREGEDAYLEGEPALQIIPKEEDCHKAVKYQDILKSWMNKDI